MVAYTCEYAKNHWIAYFKWVDYTVYKLYHIKAVTEKKQITVPENHGILKNII